jgi:hypothetical protein
MYERMWRFKLKMKWIYFEFLVENLLNFLMNYNRVDWESFAEFSPKKTIHLAMRAWVRLANFSVNVCHAYCAIGKDRKLSFSKKFENFMGKMGLVDRHSHAWLSTRWYTGPGFESQTLSRLLGKEQLGESKKCLFGNS